MAQQVMVLATIHPPIHLSIIYPFSNSFVSSSIFLMNHLPVCLLTIHLSNSHPFTHLPIIYPPTQFPTIHHPLVHPPIHPSSICLSPVHHPLFLPSLPPLPPFIIYLIFHLSIPLFLLASICLTIIPSTHPSIIYTSIHHP